MRDWGQGAFTGCHRVRELDYRIMPGQVSCMKEVLSELHEQLLVTYRDEGGYARLLFPEYFEEGVENTPCPYPDDPGTWKRSVLPELF